MRKKLFIGACVLILAMIAVLSWPTTGYDINQVHPSLRELKTPYQSVNAGYYLDGGSISITIIDRDTRKLELALPVSSERKDRTYPRLFIGAKHMSNTGAAEVAFSDNTRLMLIAAVEEHLQPTNYNDLVLVDLRGAPRDHARMGIHTAARFCQRLMK